MSKPAIVGLNTFLESSDLPEEGLDGLLWRFFWCDGLTSWYLKVLLHVSAELRTHYIDMYLVLVHFFAHECSCKC